MSVQAEDLSPFKHRNGAAPGGINVDLVEAIAFEVGVPLHFEEYSIAEGRTLFQEGRLNVDCCLNEIWFPDQQEVHVFSDPLYRLIEVFVFPKGKVFPVPDTTVLRSKRVAGIKGFTYPGQENYGQRIDGASPLDVLEMVSQGEVDVAVLERHAASFYINHHKFKVEFGDPYYSVEVGVRLHVSQRHFLNDVNKAIGKLRKNGVIDDIIKRNIR